MYNSYNNSNNYDSDSDSNNYSIDEDFCKNVYEPEEKSITKYNIVLCEIYNELIHGISIHKYINTHYLVINRFKKFNKYYIDEYIDDILYGFHRWRQGLITHYIIRNYSLLYNRIKPEIAECIYLETGECICILKTFWIRLIQKTWKKIFKYKKQVIESRSQISSLLYKERTGNWPPICNYVPTMRGMLCCLSK